MQTHRILAAVLLLVAAGWSGSVHAVEWTIDTSAWTKYVSAESGKVLYEGPGQQTNINAKFTNGCAVNIWDWRAYTRDEKKGNYSEVDYGVSCTRPLGDWNVTAGISYFDLPKQFSSAGDMIVGQLGVNTSVVSGGNMWTIYGNIKPVHVIGSADGFWIEVGASDLVKINSWLSILIGSRLEYDTGVYAVTPGLNARTDVTAIVSVRRNLDWKIGARWTAPISCFENPNDSRHNEIAGWTGLSARF